MVRCPVPGHNDTVPSVAVMVSDTGNTIITCHGGCAREDVVAAWGLTMKDLMNPDSPIPDKAEQGEWTPEGPASDIYNYVDEQGKLLYQVLRVPKPGGKKTFRQRRPDPSQRSGWAWNLQDTRRVPYRLPQLLAAIDQGATVAICYTPDTEVLTETGWVALPELPHGAPVAQWDMATEQISFAAPTAYQAFHHTGDLIHIKGRWCDHLVTPDHLQPRRSPYDMETHAPTKKVTADRIKRRDWLPVAGKLSGEGGPMEAHAKLLVAWLADGVNEQRGFKISFNLKKERKKERLRKLLADAGIPHTEHHPLSTPGWTGFRITRDDFQPVLQYASSKHWSWEWLHWHPDTRAAMIEELAHWDGDHVSTNSIRHFTANKADADIVSALASTTGYGVGTRTDIRPERPQQNTQYVININRREWRQLSSAPERVPYDGDVWCLTVPTGNLLVRRNGKTLISSNCEGEKDVHTLERLGVTATTNSGGAGKWLPEFAQYFRDGVKVIVIADNDAPGREHARKVKHQLAEVGANVTVAEPIEGCKDVTDHINAGRTLGELNIIENVAAPDYGLIDIRTLVEEEDEPYDWLIPDLLERGERLIITGMEGGGKTMLLRQIALFAAAGIHPIIWDHDRVITPIEPKKVLWIDAENSRKQNRRTLAPLYHLTSQLEHRIQTGHFTIAIRTEGLDLHKTPDQEWLDERLAIVKPDLLVIGPWYRLYNADPSDENTTRHVIQTLDTLRAKYGHATLIEAHSPHTTGGPNKRGGVRPVRPIGSSILLRWPEFGFGLSFRDNNDPNHPDSNGLPDFTYADWLAWRGARDERKWPQAFTRGNGHPGDPPWLATNLQPHDSTPGQRNEDMIRSDTQNAYSRGRGGTYQARSWEKD